MPRFYCDGVAGEDLLYITGDDVNHIKNVLRLRVGDEITVTDGQGMDYRCEISDLSDKNAVACHILAAKENDTELPVRIVLYQGLPKKDKMELIIQKAVELGVSEIVPVSMKRSIMKVEDDKSEAKKNARWTEIARAAGKQSGRGKMPVVGKVLSMKEAVKRAALDCENGLIAVPYENSRGMLALSDMLDDINQRVDKKSFPTVSVFIGPEGGFEESEIELLKANGAETVSLGKRILRTETAGLTFFSILMYEVEKNIDKAIIDREK